MFAIRNWESHYDLKATKGALELWFTIEIAGPPSGTYPVVVDFIWPGGSAARVPKTFAIPFNMARVSQVDVKASLDNVKAGNYALRLTVAGEQLDDLPFTVRGGPRIRRLVIKAQEVESGKLLASVATQEDLYGDTGILSFESIPAELPTEVEIARQFAKAYGDHEEGRTLRSLTASSPFPDIKAIDASTGATVTMELTQLAYEGWQEMQAHAGNLKKAVRSILLSQRPRYRGRAMILYFNRDNKRPRLPNPATKRGKDFLKEFQQALEGGFWIVHDLPPGDSGKALRLETLTAPAELSVFHHHLRKVELGPNDPSDPRLESPEDPLLQLQTEKVIEEGEFSNLVAKVLTKKLVRGESYSADILLIHNAADPHVLVAAEDDSTEDLARAAVQDSNAHEKFKEIWLFDIWGNSAFKL